MNFLKISRVRRLKHGKVFLVRSTNKKQCRGSHPGVRQMNVFSLRLQGQIHPKSSGNSIKSGISRQKKQYRFTPINNWLKLTTHSYCTDSNTSPGLNSSWG